MELRGRIDLLDRAPAGDRTASSTSTLYNQIQKRYEVIIIFRSSLYVGSWLVSGLAVAIVHKEPGNSGGKAPVFANSSLARAV